MIRDLRDKEKMMRDKPKTTKKSQLIAMLGKKGGVTVEQIGSKLGWQPHTVRAALTGLRKAGHEIELKKPESGDAGSYRIVTKAQSAK